MTDPNEAAAYLQRAEEVLDTANLYPTQLARTALDIALAVAISLQEAVDSMRSIEDTLQEAVAQLAAIDGTLERSQ